MLRYCVKCVMPSTKPDLDFDEKGVCAACNSYSERSEDEYKARQEELTNILDKYKSKDGKNWDCIIPVSGGKDSTYQAIKARELGMNPLLVNATTCHESEIGKVNIQNLVDLGFDMIKISPNIQTRRKLNKIGLEQVGDISWPEHVGIFTIPVSIAVKFNIPLIIWGENSQHEYGGPAASQNSPYLDRRWLEEFGGLLGLRVNDLIGMEDLSKEDLLLYQYPSDEDIHRVGVTGLFLGHYFPWDGLSNALIAKANGFKTLGDIVEGSMVDYENLDNLHTGIHDYFKFLKFGFGRTTDIACLHVRRGRITREQALSIVKENDGKFPSSYLKVPLEEILEPLNMSVEEFEKICDRFTNKKIFEKFPDGSLKKDRHRNLTKVNYDNL